MQAPQRAVKVQIFTEVARLWIDKFVVDRRREPRIQVNHVVMAAGLDEQTDIPPFEARVFDVSGRGVRLRVPFYLNPGVALRLEKNNEVFLGEVIYCETCGDQLYAGINIEQAFCLTPQLARLWSGLPTDRRGRPTLTRK